MSQRGRVLIPASLLLVVTFLASYSPTPEAKTAVTPPPLPALFRSAPVEFPGEVDSNSPAYWAFDEGVATFHLLTSSGHPQLNLGPSYHRLQPAGVVTYSNEIDGRRWIEAVVPDGSGTLYGYYHLEPNGTCRRAGLTAPRIGAARSTDNGRSWEDLGIILEAPPYSTDCLTPNTYFAGGVGDFTVLLDDNQYDLYFFFSTYSRWRHEQGVAVARMQWADRDMPVGNVAAWRDGVWMYPSEADDREFVYPAAQPVFPAAGSWHDRRGRVDAFWGPSVHWNTFLAQYVMLLNRASDLWWTQEGIYISFARSLDDPRLWTTPQRLLAGGGWYPQVIGVEHGQGTDKQAGEYARFFMGGRSEYTIVFRRPAT